MIYGWRKSVMYFSKSDIQISSCTAGDDRWFITSCLRPRASHWFMYHADYQTDDCFLFTRQLNKRWDFIIISKEALCFCVCVYMIIFIDFLYRFYRLLRTESIMLIVSQQVNANLLIQFSLYAQNQSTRKLTFKVFYTESSNRSNWTQWNWVWHVIAHS